MKKKNNGTKHKKNTDRKAKIITVQVNNPEPPKMETGSNLKTAVGKTHKLMFDHKTGDLLISNREYEPKETEMIVDQIYQDGFFCKKAA